jgi:hypothetical protein
MVVLRGSIPLYTSNIFKMGTVYDLIKSVRETKSRLPDLTQKVVNSNKQEILDYNRQDQLFKKGETSDGTKIVPPYTNVTKNFKLLKGQPINRVTLFDTGSFYKGFEIKKNSKYQISIYSKDEKSGYLMDKYGNNIFGINKINQKKLNQDTIKPDLWKLIIQSLKL